MSADCKYFNVPGLGMEGVAFLIWPNVLLWDQSYRRHYINTSKSSIVHGTILIPSHGGHINVILYAKLQNYQIFFWKCIDHMYVNGWGRPAFPMLKRAVCWWKCHILEVPASVLKSSHQRLLVNGQTYLEMCSPLGIETALLSWNVYRRGHSIDSHNTMGGADTCRYTRIIWGTTQNQRTGQNVSFEHTAIEQKLNS